ncbi:hypothetical protein FE257_006854 [Aspergillus nanangensis]|uniref:Uncharacterized protein n=1 Tax=Aspergillus nanangensis TaxID=2582783 RepID=A0AAD4CNX3_ASPNN|nr:hypothetical protein FE257_006854 [Aspergillus nanangensis]
MHSSVLLLVLSTIGAQAVPLLRSRGNETLQRRDNPYSIVNVGDQSSSEAPPVQTVVVANPPEPPVTITVTNTPSATPSPCSTSIPGAYPSWPVGPLSTGTPNGEKALTARGYNSTEMSARSLRRAAVANATESRTLFSRHNETEPHLRARSNETAAHDARSIGVLSGRGALPRGSNETGSHLQARNLNVTERALRFTRELINSTETKLKARGLNRTTLSHA